MLPGIKERERPDALDAFFFFWNCIIARRESFIKISKIRFVQDDFNR